MSLDTIRNNGSLICIQFIAFSGHNTKLAAPLSLLDMMRQSEGVEGDARLRSFRRPCPLTEGGKLLVAITLERYVFFSLDTIFEVFIRYFLRIYCLTTFFFLREIL